MSRFRSLRRQGCGLARGLLVCAIGVAAACTRDEARAPNFVLVTADRLSAQRIACFGGPRDAGQSLCRLGRAGTLFAWTLTPGTGVATTAATLLTGRSAGQHGLDDSGLTFLTDDQTAVAEHFKAAGYATAAFVESPELNRSRRLDQGFDLYDDAAARAGDLAARVGRWVETARAPYFLWIQLGAGTRLRTVDRLVARLDPILGAERADTGVLFTSLRGEVDLGSEIRLETHRIPLIWRAPRDGGQPTAPEISYALASLVDVAPTLQAGAGGAHAAVTVDAPHPNGQPLDRLVDVEADPDRERFFLLEGTAVAADVGLAASRALYVRKRSPLDDSGRPLPTTALSAFSPRFLTFAATDSDPTMETLARATWRSDVLSPDSPVPRLEFRLVQRLRRGPASVTR